MERNNPSKVVIIPRPPVANGEEEAPVAVPRMAAPPTPVPAAQAAAAPATDPQPAPAPAPKIPKAKPIKDLKKKIDKTELPPKPIVK